MPNPLTHRQEQLLRYMLDCELTPSFREMMAHFGYTSMTGVRDHLQALRTKGWLAQPVHTAARAVRLPERWPYALQLPAKWCPCCRGALVEMRCLRCRVTISVKEAAPT